MNADAMYSARANARGAAFVFSLILPVKKARRFFRPPSSGVKKQQAIGLLLL